MVFLGRHDPPFHIENSVVDLDWEYYYHWATRVRIPNVFQLMLRLAPLVASAKTALRAQKTAVLRLFKSPVPE